MVKKIDKWGLVYYFRPTLRRRWSSTTSSGTARLASPALVRLLSQLLHQDRRCIPTFVLLFRPRREFLMDDGIDDPVRRIGSTWPCGSRQPAQGLKLLKCALGVVARELAHGSVAALNVTIGDALALTRQDVSGDSGEAIMISFQNPPDLILYTGARDSKKPGAAPPKGVITPGAVKFLNFERENGLVTSPAMGSARGAFAHRKLKPSETFKAKVEAEAEQLLFVWRGSLQVRDKWGSYSAAEKDTVFVTGPAELEATAGPQETTVIHVQAPPARQ